MDLGIFFTHFSTNFLLKNYFNYEIIVVDTSNRPSKDKYKNIKKLRYFHIKEKFKRLPVLNQMYQIEFGLKKSKGKFICLLDGDDKFSNMKLYKISKMLKSYKKYNTFCIPGLVLRPFFVTRPTKY